MGQWKTAGRRCRRGGRACYNNYSSIKEIQNVQVVLADGKPSLESAEETSFYQRLERWDRGEKSRFSQRIHVAEEDESKAGSQKEYTRILKRKDVAFPGT